MSITLNGHVYRVVRDSDGKRLVIREDKPGVWRVSDLATEERILAGFLLAPLRLAP